MNLSRRFSLLLFAILAIAFIVATGPANAQALRVITGAPVLNAVTTTGASEALPTSWATSLEVQLFAASGTSSSTITIEQSLDKVHWFIVATISNVASTGTIYAGPSAPWTRVNLSARSSGTISAFVAGRTMTVDPIGPTWASIAG